MAKIVEMYLPKSQGNLVVIKSEEAAGGIMYSAWWTATFSYQVRLGGDEDLERARAIARSSDSEITPIADLGQYPLFSKKEGKGIAVGLERGEFGCTRSIKAGKVPSGSFLCGHALDFFIFWKGPEAVDRSRRRLL